MAIGKWLPGTSIPNELHRLSNFPTPRPPAALPITPRPLASPHCWQASSGTRREERAGCCYDNAVMERFFWSLKHEWTNNEGLHNPEEARLSVFRYIETFYNPLRLHQTLGYLSPQPIRSRSRPGYCGVIDCPAGVRKSCAIALRPAPPRRLQSGGWSLSNHSQRLRRGCAAIRICTWPSSGFQRHLLAT